MHASLPYLAFLNVLFSTTIISCVNFDVTGDRFALLRNVPKHFFIFLSIHYNSFPSSVIFSLWGTLSVSLMFAYNFKSVALGGGGSPECRST